jgi:hypothetical protein
MAAIQAQLARMEAVLNDVVLSVGRVASLLERQQRSKLQAALRMLRDTHERTRSTSELSDVDWQRLTGIELELEAQLDAVGDELQDCLSVRFTGNPKRDAGIMDQLGAERVRELVELHRLLIGGLRQWNALLLLRKTVLANSMRTRRKGRGLGSDNLLNGTNISSGGWRKWRRTLKRPNPAATSSGYSSTQFFWEAGTTAAT